VTEHSAPAIVSKLELSVQVDIQLGELRKLSCQLTSREMPKRTHRTELVPHTCQVGGEQQIDAIAAA